MDDSYESPYKSCESDTETPSRQGTPRLQTPDRKDALGSVASEPPSTLRRSTRPPMPVRRLDPAAAAKPSQTARGGAKSGSHEHTIQTLLKLPGFGFTSTNNIFNSKDGAHLATILGAQFEGNYRRSVAASEQRTVCVRVANVIEVCCDEWLEGWQGEALTSDFWVGVAERLRCYSRYWAAVNATPVQVNMICMAYTGHWEENGRGGAPDDDEGSWGFQLGELTWGKAKAEIDPDLFAKPWEYERACELCLPSFLFLGQLHADGLVFTENAARDFFEYVSETETTFGPIQNAVGAKSNDRNKTTNRRRRGRSLVAPGEIPEGSRPRAVATNLPYQFVHVDEDEPVIMRGPRRAKYKRSDGNVLDRVRATVDRSDPNRLLVKFSGLVFKGDGQGHEGKQAAQQSDEGKDVTSTHGEQQAGEDIKAYSLYEEPL